MLVTSNPFLKARCHYQSFLCQRKLWQSFWWNFDSDNGPSEITKAMSNLVATRGSSEPVSLMTWLFICSYVQWSIDFKKKTSRVRGCGCKRHFQQYFRYIVAVSFTGGGNTAEYLEKTTDIPQLQVADKLDHRKLYRVHLGIRTQNLNIIKIGWKIKFCKIYL